MSFEDDLQRRLRAQASSVAVRDDYADVTARSARHAVTQRRALVAALAFALVAGPLAGFATARATSSHDDAKVVAGAAGLASEGKASLRIGGGTGTWQRLFVRTTRDGVTLRVYRQPFVSPRCGTAGACPNAPSGLQLITVEASNGGAITFGSMSSGAPAKRDGFGESIQGVFGTSEGAPGLWVVAEVGADVSTVRAHFRDGSSDDMQPVDGIVAFGRATTDIHTTLDALDADGHVLLSQPVQGMQACYSKNPGACTVGSGSSSSGSSGTTASTLPPPGTAPADKTAAETAIEAAYADVYTGANPKSVKEAAIEDGSSVASVLGVVANGPYAAQALASTVHVDTIVFTSPTTAAVRYDLIVPSYDERGHVGGAVLQDGRWKVARSTFCADLALGGVKCPG